MSNEKKKALAAIVNRGAHIGYGAVAASVARRRHLFPKIQAFAGDVHREHRRFDASAVGVHYEKARCPNFYGVGCHRKNNRPARTRLSYDMAGLRGWQPDRYPAQQQVVPGPTGRSPRTWPDRRQSHETRCLKENRRPGCNRERLRKIMTGTVHTTAACRRKAGAVIVSRFSQAAQEKARHLDHMADRELAVGRHSAAERLSNIAHELREEVQ
jgi:hypothetical protein